MANPMFGGIDSIFQAQNAHQVSVTEAFDLSDDRFSNILDGKLEDLKQNIAHQEDNIVEKLGIPAGLEIEGFDYNSVADNIIPSTDKIDEINTESNIKGDKVIDIESLWNTTKDTLTPLVNNTGTTSPIKAVQNFWEHQASNFYSIMNKDIVDDISDLITKLS